MDYDNPLLEKYDEIYGEKPEPKEEPKEETTKEPESEFVIPTAQVTSTGINLTGGYVMPSALISNGTSIIGSNSLTSYTRAVSVPHQTAVEHQFFKVLEDVSRGKATVSAISADIDQSFTGFGGQIRYTVEIVGTYP